MIHRLILLDSIADGDLSALAPAERPEARRRLAQGMANLADDPAPAVTDDRALTVDEAVAMSGFGRRWFYQHDDLPWIKRLSRKKLAISERGLRRHLGLKP